MLLRTGFRVEILVGVAILFGLCKSTLALTSHKAALEEVMSTHSMNQLFFTLQPLAPAKSADRFCLAWTPSWWSAP